MALQVFTSKMSKYNHEDPDNLDITVKGDNKVFGPTWDMVLGYNAGKISKEEYTEQYYELMRKSFVEYREAWKLLLKKERIVLFCYCKPGEFCHRLLLADMLVKCGAEYKGEI